MWQYKSYFNEGENPAGKNIVRIFIENNELEECFFLEYASLPDDETVIINEANKYIYLKNQYDAKLKE